MLSSPTNVAVGTPESVSALTQTTSAVSLAANPFVSGLQIVAIAGTPFSGTVAIFNAAMPGSSPSTDYTATIHWADGSADTTAKLGDLGSLKLNTAGVLTLVPSGLGTNQFSVIGSHTFAYSANPALATVTITHLPSKLTGTSAFAVTIQAPAPTLITSSSNGSGIDLAWSGIASSYSVARYVAGVGPVIIGTSTTPSFHDASVSEPWSIHYYDIIANYGGGVTAGATYGGFAVPLLPPASVSPPASNTGAGPLVVSHVLKKVGNLYITTLSSPLSFQWAHPAGIQLPLAQIKYNVYRNDQTNSGTNVNLNGVSFRLATFSSAAATLGGTNVSAIVVPGGILFTDSSVIPGHIYNYWVAPAPTTNGTGYTEPQIGTGPDDLHLSGPPSTPANPTDYIQVVIPPMINSVRTAGANAAVLNGPIGNLPTSETITWTWNGSPTTFDVYRSTSPAGTSTLLPAGQGISGSNFSDMSISFPEPPAPSVPDVNLNTVLNSTYDPTIYYYHVVPSGTANYSNGGYAPQVYWMNGLQDTGGVNDAKFYDRAGMQVHFYPYYSPPAPSQLPNASKPLVLAGDSYGGDAAFKVAADPTLARTVNYLFLFDPVSSTVSPPSGVGKFSLSNNVARSDDWYNLDRAVDPYYSGPIANSAGTVYPVNPSTPALFNNWSVGGQHTSQIFLSDAYNRATNTVLNLPGWTT